jgi:hypothetical protein
MKTGVFLKARYTDHGTTQLREKVDDDELVARLLAKERPERLGRQRAQPGAAVFGRERRGGGGRRGKLAGRGGRDDGDALRDACGEGLKLAQGLLAAGRARGGGQGATRGRHDANVGAGANERLARRRRGGGGERVHRCVLVGRVLLVGAREGRTSA